jgi:mannose-6-phosphate isomerase
VYLDAGQIHAYLHGVGVEIMASSDNVLRCGLTVKHVDAAEVLRIADFEATDAAPLEAQAGVEGWSTFVTPVDDFRLAVINVAGDPVPVRASGGEILLRTAGAGQVSVAGQEIAMSRGEAIFLSDKQACLLTGEGTVFRASAGIS